MFGKNTEKEAARTFEQAKEATRRASFLNATSQLPDGHPDRQDLVMLLRVCRAAALASGKSLGKTEPDVDAEIASLADADIMRLKQKSQREIQNFAGESVKITQAFLATVDPVALAATTQQGTRH
jgi:hypothetical protein